MITEMAGVLFSSWITSCIRLLQIAGYGNPVTGGYLMHLIIIRSFGLQRCRGAGVAVRQRVGGDPPD